MLSNFLVNSPMTWLNQKLIPYVARLNIIPETQVATNQGVQTRDVMSFLSGIMCYSSRNKQPVYALQRDQMKGFDYLLPSGFYDAMKAYGFPDSIRKLDEAAQTQTRAFVCMAYSVTGPIIVNGLMKQGGPLSPIKSTLTTSLGHHYLDDLAKNDPGTLVLKSKSHQSGDPHTPLDNIQLQVTMVEATDDSYLFATTPETLAVFCLEMERFQYAYGWLTQWAKTNAYIINPTDEVPETIKMPSITLKQGIDPWVISHHDVPIRVGELEFLRTKVDDPVWRYQGLRDFIDSFKFPKLTFQMPITLLRKIVVQCITSRCRALILIHPIKDSDAVLLDQQITGKVHQCFGFPYCPNTNILTLPISHLGMEFPSIARINTGIAVEGLARDLNHHIPAYRSMARLTLADWTCDINGCVNPLDGRGLAKDFTRYYRKIPASWIFAQKGMSKLKPKLSLCLTDSSHIIRGDLSITHALKLCQVRGNEVPNGLVLHSIVSKGLRKLSDVGCWQESLNGCLIFVPYSQPAPREKWTVTGKDNWRKVAKVLGEMKCEWLYEGEKALLLTRTDRRNKAKAYIHTLPLLVPLQPSQLPHNGRTWTSDGSMIPAASGLGDAESVTAAVTGPDTIVLRLNGQNLSILQGELMGQIMGLILSSAVPKDTSLYSDLLNSVRLIEDSRSSISQDARLRNMNGRSYYRWILDLAKEVRTMVNYMKGHSDEVTLASLLNYEADYYASKSQKAANSLHPAPLPTFYMDEYTFYRPIDGWIESHIHTFIDYFLTEATAEELAIGHGHRMAMRLYDKRSPPTYPYLRASSAYTALVQLYARSGQLPTAEGMVQKGQSKDNGCRVGCKAVEDMHHIFVESRNMTS